MLVIYPGAQHRKYMLTFCKVLNRSLLDLIFAIAMNWNIKFKSVYYGEKKVECFSCQYLFVGIAYDFFGGKVLGDEAMRINKLEVRDSNCFDKAEYNSDKSHVEMTMIVHNKSGGGAEKIEYFFQNTLAQSIKIRVWEDISQSFMITYLLNGREVSKPHVKHSTDNRVLRPLKEIFLPPGDTYSWLFEIKSFLNGNKLPDELIKGGYYNSFGFLFLVRCREQAM
ncbi:hypothetical protein [Methylomonas sp. CM2]|uniref:hypothetical protein n=1 Tax=Methylomonas sp. CM2 TaxID=3417647 RepID=UPI003CF95C57